MKSPLISFLAALSIVAAGCATTKPTACPTKYPSHYADTARGFTLCLPNGLKKTEANSMTTFTGFTVPAGTNLQSKSLIVVSGNYDMLAGARPSGSVTADGVTLKRVLLDDGSAGHSTLHVIYTWQKPNSRPVHFDCTHRAVNPAIVDPRPAAYDQAAQIKLSEEIMSTFKVAK